MSDQKLRAGTSRSPSRGAAPSRPNSTVAAVAVAVIVALLAMLILKSMGDDEPKTAVQGTKSSVAAAPVTDPETGAPVTTVLASPVTTQAAVPDVSKADFLFVIANNSGKDKAAGKMTEQLVARGYKALKAANVKPGIKPIAQTQIYYRTGGEAAAQLIKKELGVIAEPVPMKPAGFPVEAANLGVAPQDALVIVLLGTDKALTTLPAAAAATVPPTSAP